MFQSYDLTSGNYSGRVIGQTEFYSIRLSANFTNTSIQGGFLDVYSTSTASLTHLSSGYLNVHTGDTANGTVVDGGYQIIDAGGSASSSIFNGGYDNVSGTETGARFNGGVYLTVGPGGSEVGATIASGVRASFNGGSLINA